MADEFDLLALGAESGGGVTASGGDEFDRLALKREPVAVEPSQDRIMLTEEKTLGNLLRPVARGSARGLFGLGTLAPEAILSGAKAVVEEGPGLLLSGFGANPLVKEQIARYTRGALPYEYGGFSEDYMNTVNKEIIDEVIPKQKGDFVIPEIFSEYAAPGGVLTKMMRKIPVLAKLLGTTKQEVASILFGSAAGTAGELTDIPYAGPLFSVAGGATGHNLFSASKKAVPLAKKGYEAAKENINARKGKFADGFDEFTTQAEDAADELAERLALKRLEELKGKQGLDKILTKLDEGTPRVEGESVAQYLDDPEILGVEEHLARTTDIGAEAREGRNARLEKGLQKQIKGDVPDIDDAREISVQNMEKRAARKKAEYKAEYDAIDPENTTSIPYADEMAELEQVLKTKFADGLEEGGLLSRTVRQFRTGELKHGKADSAKGFASWNVMQAWRSKAKKVLRNPNATPDDQRLAPYIIDYVDRATAKAAETGVGFSPEQQALWKSADRKRRIYETEFGSKTLPGKMLRRDDAAGKLYPSQWAKKLIAEGTSEEQATRAFNTIPKADRPAARASILQEMEKQATDVKTGIVDFGEYTQIVDRTLKRTGDLFTPAHKQNLRDFISGAQKRAQQEVTAKSRAGTSLVKGEQGQNMYQSVVKMYQSRLGWKYPIQRKVIQLYAAGKRIKGQSLQELVDSKLLRLMDDEEFFKQLLMKRDKKEVAEFLKSTNGSQFRAKLDGVFNSTLDTLKKAYVKGKPYAKEYAQGQAARATRVAGPLGSELGDRTEEKKDIDTLLGPRPNEAPGLFEKKKTKREIAVPQDDFPEEPTAAPEEDNLLSAVRQIESSGGKNLLSPAGAEGPYQLMPATGKRIHKMLKIDEPYDPYDEAQSKRIAAYHIKDGLKRFGSLELALADYNAGHPAIAKAIKRAGSKEWPKVKVALEEVGNTETAEYVGKVLGLV